MSFLQKLCDVYDAIIDTTGAEGENALLPIGFIQKKIKYNVLLSPSGEFVTAQLLPDDAQAFAVPSTPQAEGRTGTNGAPFPLADGLKYLIAGQKNPLFDSYVEQLENWCRAPHAPECLRVLLTYLKKKTLYADLHSIFGAKLKYYKDENDTTGEGADAKSIACFSITWSCTESCFPTCEPWARKGARVSTSAGLLWPKDGSVPRTSAKAVRSPSDFWSASARSFGR